VSNSSLLTKHLQTLGAVLRLRGRAQSDPTARILHILVVGLLIFLIIENAIVLQFISPKTIDGGIVTPLNLFVLAATLILLRRSIVSQASLAYVAGTWLLTTVLMLLPAGIHSVRLVVLVTLPISAAWLFGYPAALWTAGVCLASSLVTVLLEMRGVGPLWYSQGHPLGLWLVVVEALLIGSVPVAQVLRILKEALALSESAQKELRDYQDNLEELVQQRTSELQAANRAKSVFFANMSHELRTPLHAILGFSTLVRDDPGLSQQHRHDLDIVNRSGERLLDLIDDVLDVAKIESGIVVVDNAPFDLRDVIQDTLDIMRPRARAKNLDLALAVFSDFPRFARSDAGKLRQVLVNLIGNAVKYTERGCVFLRLDSKPMEDPRQLRLTFEVLDTGIGIAAEDQARIFAPFVQAGKTGSQNGTGLGLNITRQFVELMGGTIRVTSTLGKGSAFRVDLPAQKAEESDVMAASPAPQKITGLAPGQPEYRILIVEDNRESWLLLRRQLQEAGFSVRVAEDGAQGIEILRAWRPSLIWMDLRLPVIGGLEAVRRIRELDFGREVKIVAISASAFAHQRDELLAAGFNDFVLKPCRRDQIFDCIARQLGVRYLYGEAAPAKEPASALCQQALAALPEELRRELMKAVISLDTDYIAAAIGRVSEHDGALGKALERQAARFAYTKILNALEDGGSYERKVDDRQVQHPGS
jgi:signal transduction histidine kinase/DNA-binding NarL/FixJ family response regulator